MLHFWCVYDRSTMLVSLESTRRHTLHMNLFISKMLAETHGRGEKVLFLSSLSLSLDKQAKCYPVSISIETRGGGWTGLNSLPIFDLASRKRKARLSFLLLVFFPFFSSCPQGVELTPKKNFLNETRKCNLKPSRCECGNNQTPVSFLLITEKL